MSGREKTNFSGERVWSIALFPDMRKLHFGGAFLGSLIALVGLGRLGAQTAPDASAGNDSAYTALRLVAKTLGKESLGRVVEVTGRDGVPQPALWKITLQEGAGGTREVDVAGGKITAQRTLPNPPAAKTVIHFPDLNLDSSGAFDATDAQARKVRVRFDSVNYVLRTSESSGKPQWTLNLFDKNGAGVGAMRLSASDGNIVSIDGRLATGSPTATPRGSESATTGTRVTESAPASSRPRESRTTTTTTTVIAPPAPPSPPPPAPPAPVTTETVVVDDTPVDHGEGGFFTRTGRTLDKTTHTVGEQFDKTGHVVGSQLRRAGATVQRFFTGHSDLDGDAPPPPPPPHDPNYRGD